MAEIVVHFNSGKRDLRATSSSAQVRGVLRFRNDAERREFLRRNGANGGELALEQKRVPSQVTLTTESGDSTTLREGEEGPPVCYWVDGTLVCW